MRPLLSKLLRVARGHLRVAFLLPAILCWSACLAQSSATVDNLSTNQQGSNISSNSNNISTTASQSTTYNGNAPGSTPPPSAIAPAFMGGGQDSCLIGVSGAVSSSIIGISAGSYKRDDQCELLKLAKTLNEFGLKVAAVATLCQDTRVFQAMAMAGTPCPYLGAIGKQATILWQQNPEARPDYEIKPLKPISLATGIRADDGGSLSDRYRASKRASPQPSPAGGSN
jgi:hypothetical protein